MIIIRKARKGDEVGISEMIKEGLKRKNWLYTGINVYNQEKLDLLKDSLANRTKVIFVAVDTEKNKIVGDVDYLLKNMGRIRHRIDLGWGIHPDYQGRGIG